jgi:hypothetical protein
MTDCSGQQNSRLQVYPYLQTTSFQSSRKVFVHWLPLHIFDCNFSSPQYSTAWIEHSAHPSIIRRVLWVTFLTLVVWFLVICSVCCGWRWTLLWPCLLLDVIIGVWCFHYGRLCADFLLWQTVCWLFIMADCVVTFHYGRLCADFSAWFCLYFNVV